MSVDPFMALELRRIESEGSAGKWHAGMSRLRNVSELDNLEFVPREEIDGIGGWHNKAVVDHLQRSPEWRFDRSLYGYRRRSPSETQAEITRRAQPWWQRLFG